MSASGKVTIGLPVFNGENYLAAAIESVLGQTYRNLELIVCDNASEDRTESICRDFAARDQRVVYHRNPTNIGAAANHNKCVHLATGEYFKWMSHDDLLEPRYIEECVKALEADKDAILAQCIVHCFDMQGRVFEIYDHSTWNTGSENQAVRLHAALCNPRCLEIFGLVRTKSMASSILQGGYTGADRTVVVDLALRGRFVLVPEPLFLNRDHPTRSSRWTNRLEYLSWWTGQKGQWKCSTGLFYRDCLKLINRYANSPADRLSCYRELLHSLRLFGRRRRLFLEPLAAVNPRLIKYVTAAKRSIAQRRRPAADREMQKQN